MEREREGGNGLGELGEGEDVGGTEGGADPIEDGACVVVLERPLKAIGIQFPCSFVAQFP